MEFAFSLRACLGFFFFSGCSAVLLQPKDMYVIMKQMSGVDVSVNGCLNVQYYFNSVQFCLYII